MTTVDTYDFHDAELLRMQFIGKAIELDFSLADSTRVTVRLNGVSRMLCNGIREGNTVLELAEVGRTPIASSLLKQLFELSEAEMRSPAAFLSEIRRKLELGELCMIHIAPTYGINLVALCEGVNVYTAA